MWGESSQNCENNCQCSGLITESFRINSGNSATKRKQSEATTTNYKSRMHPHCLDFKTPLSPLLSPRATPSKRRVLGEIQNEQGIESPFTKYTNSSESKVSLSTLFRPKVSPIDKMKCQAFSEMNSSPVSSRKLVKRSTAKISRIFEERSLFRMSSNKENLNENETFVKLDFQESSLDLEESSLRFEESSLKLDESSLRFEESHLDLKETRLGVQARLDNQDLETLEVPQSQAIEDLESSLVLEDKEQSIDLNLEEETRPFGFHTSVSSDWTSTKLDFTDALQLQSTSPVVMETKLGQQEFCVPEKDYDLADTDFETLHDLEEEFENDNFDLCTKYEIISTDSPNIISRGRTSSSQKISSKNFIFGAPIGEDEQSTTFNTKNNINATRTLNFEDKENFEFTSPTTKKRESFSVKKSLKFTEIPAKSYRPFGEGCSYDKSPNAIKMLKLSDTPSKSFSKCLKFSATPPKFSPTPPKFSPTPPKFSPTPPKFSPTQTKYGATPTKMGITPTKSFLHPLRHERSDSSIGSMASPTSSMSSSQPSTRFRLFTSSSTTSMESGFISELEENLEIEDHSNSPKIANFSELLSGPIKDDIFSTSKTFLKRPLLQRSLSFNPEATKLKVRQSLFSEEEKKSQKRQDPLVLEVSNKKMKPDVEKRPVLQRALSENHASIIMNALARSCTEPDLIGDFSVPYALPLTVSQHSDLKAISCDTLAELLKGNYDDTIKQYQVIDCRYPYEFEGGHINGALNVYSPQQVNQLLASGGDHERRSILVFHCEFSLERGPKLYRYLRSTDRSKNAENYPNLNYPEIYLLHDGYRTFYQRHPSLCTPAGYTPMLSPSHAHLLRKHRSSEQPASFFTHHRSKRDLS